MRNRTLAAIAAAGLLGVTTFAHADYQANPLDPGYYRGKPTHIDKSADYRPYVDTHDPETPTYYVGKPSVPYEGTVSQDSRPYRDVNNPLDPAYRPPTRTE